MSCPLSSFTSCAFPQNSSTLSRNRRRSTLNSERKKRKALSAKKRIALGPLYVVAGVPRPLADEVEQRVRRTLGNGLGGEVLVPRVDYKTWYSEEEVAQVFRAAAKKVVAEVETATARPTPSSVFLLHVAPPSATQLDILLRWCAFWAWPEELRPTRPDPAIEGLPPSAQTHWIRTPTLAAAAVVSAAHQLQGHVSRWARIAGEVRRGKSALRLPPVNFRFPNEGSHLCDAYWSILQGLDTDLPRLHRVGPGSHRILGNEHYRDASGRFFPLGKGEHGAFRELESVQRDDRVRLVWLNAAYRFGCWVGDQQEHYDVQRTDGDVSPPDVFCARRNASAHAARRYANIFINDCVRDADIFRNEKAQR